VRVIVTDEALAPTEPFDSERVRSRASRALGWRSLRRAFSLTSPGPEGIDSIRDRRDRRRPDPRPPLERVSVVRLTPDANSWPGARAQLGTCTLDGAVRLGFPGRVLSRLHSFRGDHTRIA